MLPFLSLSFFHKPLVDSPQGLQLQAQTFAWKGSMPLWSRATQSESTWRAGPMQSPGPRSRPTDTVLPSWELHLQQCFQLTFCSLKFENHCPGDPDPGNFQIDPIVFAFIAVPVCLSIALIAHGKLHPLIRLNFFRQADFKGERVLV